LNIFLRIFRNTEIIDVDQTVKEHQKKLLSE